VICVYREWEIMTGTVTTVIGPALYLSAQSAGVFSTLRALMTTPSWKVTMHSYVLSARFLHFSSDSDIYTQITLCVVYF